MEKKCRCIICKKCLGTPYHKKFKDTIRVKTNLFGTTFDKVLHAKCWEKLKIYS